MKDYLWQELKASREQFALAANKEAANSRKDKADAESALAQQRLNLANLQIKNDTLTAALGELQSAKDAAVEALRQREQVKRKEESTQVTIAAADSGAQTEEGDEGLRLEMERSRLEAALDEAQEANSRLEDELKKTEASLGVRLTEIQSLKNELTRRQVGFLNTIVTIVFQLSFFLPGNDAERHHIAWNQV